MIGYYSLILLRTSDTLTGLNTLSQDIFIAKVKSDTTATQE
jgi:hypothetical protein